MSGVCAEDEWRCLTLSTCIPMRSYCDGIRDCPDGTDETGFLNSRCGKYMMYIVNGLVLQVITYLDFLSIDYNVHRKSPG